MLVLRGELVETTIFEGIPTGATMLLGLVTAGVVTDVEIAALSVGFTNVVLIAVDVVPIGRAELPTGSVIMVVVARGTLVLVIAKGAGLTAMDAVPIGKPELLAGIVITLVVARGILVLVIANCAALRATVPVP
jgi:hypothetical protein